MQKAYNASVKFKIIEIETDKCEKVNENMLK